MTDELQLLREVRSPARGPDPELAQRVRRQLIAEITSKHARRMPTMRRALPIALPALAAAVAAVVVGLTFLGRGSETAWAAALLRVAEAAPRLLVGEPGWNVTRADQLSVQLGEMTFTRGERELELHWQPARELDLLVEDRKHSSDLSSSAPVAGTEAQVFRYEGSNDFVAIWVQGDHALELRGIAASVEEFEAVLASLHEVDVDTWLSAMPESVIKPGTRAEVVDEMLADIPLPEGFDVEALKEGDSVRDRYQLGAVVSGAVACAWLDRWVAATHAGDNTAARTAADAMATSHGWTILQQMNQDGDYPEVLWEYADAMAANAPIVGGRELTTDESYAAALGCDGG
jgi:hypothetical protein